MEIDPSARVEQLERQVARLDAELTELRERVDRVDVGAPPSQWAPPVSRVEPTPSAWPVPHVDHRTTTRPDLVVDSETVLKWGGVALVVLAVGFAVSTAISRNWIGPELQLVGALAVGFALIGAGLRLRSTRPGWTPRPLLGRRRSLCSRPLASDLFVDQANTDIAFVADRVVVGTAARCSHVRSDRNGWRSPRSPGERSGGR